MMKSDLVKNVDTLAKLEGYNKTALDGVGVYKAATSSGRVPLCYSQGIIFVVQGRKQVYFDQEIYRYCRENYLVLTLPLPAECETIVESGKPLLAITVDFDMGLLIEMVRLFDDHGMISTKDNLLNAKSLFVSKCTQDLSEALLRLSECLQTPLHSEALGKSIIREIMFHVLNGPNAVPLFALVSHNTFMSRLDKVIKHLHKNYHDSLDVEQLATMANMSSSAFHRNFKHVTASSPIQYVKKIRLSRARELLQDQGLKVKQAAALVGYESPNQFSREFTRYFGHSPSEVGHSIAS